MSNPTERFMRENINRLHRRRKVTVATDEQVVEHLEAIIKRHGEGALEPFERRVLARLKGQPVPEAPLRLGGHAQVLA